MSSTVGRHVAIVRTQDGSLGRSNGRVISMRSAIPGLSDVGAYAIPLGPCAVLLASPTAIQDVLLAMEGALRAQRRDGYPPTPRIDALCAVLRRQLAEHCASAVAAGGNTAMPARADSPPWEQLREITVIEAAKLLDLQPRQVRNLAKAGRLPARKVGGCWQLEFVAAAQAARDRKGTA